MEILRKNKENQEITRSHFDRFLTPKTTPKGTPKRPQNDQKSNTKKEEETRAKKDHPRHQ